MDMITSRGVLFRPSGKNLRTLLILERLFGVTVYYLRNFPVKVVILVSNVVNVQYMHFSCI